MQTSIWTGSWTCRLQHPQTVIKLLLADPWENEGAIRQMTLYLDPAVRKAKRPGNKASMDYENGWRKVDHTKSRHPAVVETLKKQRPDRCRKAAKARHERWEKTSYWAEIPLMIQNTQ